MTDQQDVKPLPYLEFVKGALLQIQGNCKDDVSFKVAGDALKMCNEVELEGKALAKERDELASQVMQMRDALKTSLHKMARDLERVCVDDYLDRTYSRVETALALPILPAEQKLREQG